MNAPIYIPQRPTIAGLLHAQTQATATWTAAVRQLRAVYDALDPPLGCPVQGEDWEDIGAKLTEWENDMRDPEALTWEAADVVAKDRESAWQTANDARRGLG